MTEGSNRSYRRLEDADLLPHLPHSRLDDVLILSDVNLGNSKAGVVSHRRTIVN